jgi:hypothetical protein
MQLNIRSIVLGGFISATVLPGAAYAQDTREAEWTGQQQTKAAALKPYEPSGAERWLTTFRRELLEQPGGLYPYLASVYSGGGLTLGAGYRAYLTDRTHADVKGLYSIKGYYLLELSTDSWGRADGRLDFHARGGVLDAKQIAYYGIGNETPDVFSNFRMKEWYIGGAAEARPVGPVVFGGAITYEDYSLLQGEGSSPSIEQVHTGVTAPGLGVDPTYVHASASAGLDTRPSPGYARHGGLYQFTYHSYTDQDSVYSFGRVEGEIVQHIPILRENWVISLHGFTQATTNSDDQVPYFLMPYMGSGSTLRAYPSRRFRDRSSLLMSGEFRWIPNRMFLDMAIFYDTGKVAPRWGELNLKDLNSDFGIGVRFHSPLATPLRVELAKGSEGYRLVFAGSASF